METKFQLLYEWEYRSVYSFRESGVAEIHSNFFLISLQSESEVKAQKKKMSENQRSPSPKEPSAAPGTSVTSEEGPRQRLRPQSNSSPVVSSPAANVSMVPPTVNRATIQTNPADIPRQSRGAVRFGSLVLIWLLLLIIGALVVRRIYVMAN